MQPASRPRTESSCFFTGPKTGKPYTYATDGFEATRYVLATDQLGTQLDPPAHWAPEYPAIDELPPTFAVRPLVVISIVDKVRKDPGYHLSAGDVRAWEKAHGRIPEGAVVFVRSDWSKDWPSPELATRAKFPGVSLDALELLHLDLVPEAGALVLIGFPKLGGGVGGYARFIAICPPDWPHGVSVGQVADAPLPKMDRPLHWDEKLGMRVR